MQLKVNFIHLCELASLSDGKLNAMGIFENINVQVLPITFPQLYVVTNFTFLETSEKDVNQEMQIVSPSGDIISKYTVSFPVTEVGKRIGTIGTFTNISIKEEGKFLLKAIVNGEIVAENEIQIVKQ